MNNKILYLVLLALLSVSINVSAQKKTNVRRQATKATTVVKVEELPLLEDVVWFTNHCSFMDFTYKSLLDYKAVKPQLQAIAEKYGLEFCEHNYENSADMSTFEGFMSKNCSHKVEEYYGMKFTGKKGMSSYMIGASGINCYDKATYNAFLAKIKKKCGTKTYVIDYGKEKSRYYTDGIYRYVLGSYYTISIERLND